MNKNFLYKKKYIEINKINEHHHPRFICFDLWWLKSIRETECRQSCETRVRAGEMEDLTDE